MAETRINLGTLLTKAELLAPRELDAALAESRLTGRPLDRVLLETGHVFAAAVTRALATQPDSELDAGSALVVESPAAGRGVAGDERDRRLAELEQEQAALQADRESLQEELRHAREELAAFKQGAAEETVSPPGGNGAGGLRLVGSAGTAPQQEQDTGRAPEQGSDRRPKGPRLGDLLVEKGYIDRDQLAAALLESKTTGVMIGRVLLAKGWIFEEELARCLSEQWGIEYVSLMRTGVDLGTARLLPRQVGLDAAAVPVRRTADGSVTVAFADPTDDGSLTAVETYVPEFTPVVAELSDITMALRSVPEQG